MKTSSTVLWAAVAAASAVLGVAGIAVSQGASPVEARQAAMKDIGQSMKGAAPFNSPATPFDAVKVKTLMDAIAADSKKLHGLFPAGSDADPKTAADPKIWANKADFDKKLTELGVLATAAGKTTSTDSFKPAFSALGGACKSCHDTYRKKKSA